MNERKVTIRDVAKAAGVSITTVSHALNGYDDVSAATRQKVLEASRNLDYTPDPAARTLGGISRKILALIVVGKMTPDDSASYLDGIMSGAYRTAMERDYDFMLLTAPKEKQESMSFKQFCLSRELSGAILYGMGTDDLYFREAANGPIPCCSVDMKVEGESCRYLSIDNQEASRKITEVMIEEGYRNLAMVNGTAVAHVSRERLKGFQTALEEHRMPFRKNWVVNGMWEADTAQRKAEKLIHDHPEIDGFVCACDLMAIGAWRAVRSAGFRVPEDIGVCGFDGITAAEYYHGGITTVQQHPYEVGINAAHIVMDLIDGKDVPLKTNREFEIIRRHSTDHYLHLPPVS